MTEPVDPEPIGPSPWRPWRLIGLFAAGGSLAGVSYGLITTDWLLFGGVRGAVIGAAIGGGTAIFETFVAGGRARGWFSRQPFLATLAARTLVYLAIVMGSLLFGLFGFPGPGPTWAGFLDGLQRSVLFSFAVVLAFNFLNAMRQLVGGGVLLSFFTGRYHKPVDEERVFLFIDLTGSTQLTRRLGDAAYHRLLNRFYQDVGRAVLGAGGEIHRYVGDEMMVSWPVARGVAGAACFKALAGADRALRRAAEAYQAEFGAAPRFRAGLHVGSVVTGELGYERKEIGFVGDAVNVAARIEQAGRELGRSYLASDALIARLDPPPGVTVEPLGPRSLRGLDAPIALSALHVDEPAPSGVRRSSDQDARAEPKSNG